MIEIELKEVDQIQTDVLATRLNFVIWSWLAALPNHIAGPNSKETFFSWFCMYSSTPYQYSKSSQIGLLFSVITAHLRLKWDGHQLITEHWLVTTAIGKVVWFCFLGRPTIIVILHWVMEGVCFPDQVEHTPWLTVWKPLHIDVSCWPHSYWRIGILVLWW